jgi:hypothetical protein
MWKKWIAIKDYPGAKVFNTYFKFPKYYQSHVLQRFVDKEKFYECNFTDCFEPYCIYNT